MCRTRTARKEAVERVKSDEHGGISPDSFFVVISFHDGFLFVAALCPPDRPRHQPSSPLITILCAVMAGGQVGLGSWVRHIISLSRITPYFWEPKKYIYSSLGFVFRRGSRSDPTEVNDILYNDDKVTWSDCHPQQTRRWTPRWHSVLVLVGCFQQSRRRWRHMNSQLVPAVMHFAVRREIRIYPSGLSLVNRRCQVVSPELT